MNIDKVLESSYVTRFHAVPGVAPQTIAHHSWGVALLCQHLYPECRKEVILEALLHDCPELIIGDLPATVKWASDTLKEELDRMEDKVKEDWGINVELTSEEKFMIKVCDVLDGMTYCLRRQHYGDIGAKDMFYRWSNYFLKSLAYKINTKTQEYYSSLLENMEKINGPK